MSLSLPPSTPPFVPQLPSQSCPILTFQIDCPKAQASGCHCVQVWTQAQAQRPCPPGCTATCSVPPSAARVAGMFLPSDLPGGVEKVRNAVSTGLPTSAQMVSNVLGQKAESFGGAAAGPSEARGAPPGKPPAPRPSGADQRGGGQVGAGWAPPRSHGLASLIGGRAWQGWARTSR